MAGLDTILNEIAQDAALEAEKIVAEGKEIIATLKEEETKALEELLSTYQQETKQLCQLEKEKGISQADSAKRRQLLAGRQQWIDGILSQSKNYLLSLPHEAYFAVIKDLCVNHAHTESGILYLSSKDLDRLPSTFLEELTLALKENQKGQLSLGKAHPSIQGGCILSYENIEENLTFDAIFQEHKDTLEDKIVTFIPSNITKES